jgi:hypothetical protein
MVWDCEGSSSLGFRWVNSHVHRCENRFLYIYSFSSKEYLWQVIIQHVDKEYKWTLFVELVLTAVANNCKYRLTILFDNHHRNRQSKEWIVWPIRSSNSTLVLERSQTLFSSSIYASITNVISPTKRLSHDLIMHWQGEEKEKKKEKKESAWVTNTASQEQHSWELN